MLTELKEDSNILSAGMEIFMGDITKKLVPFVKPTFKHLSYTLGADDRMFIIRKVLNCIDKITQNNGDVIEKEIVNFSDDQIVYLDENQNQITLSREKIKSIELSEANLAKEISKQIDELKKIDKFHKDINPLEKKRNLLGTVCFYILDVEQIEEFKVNEFNVEFPITNPEQLLIGMITGELFTVDKTL